MQFKPKEGSYNELTETSLADYLQKPAEIRRILVKSVVHIQLVNIMYPEYFRSGVIEGRVAKCNDNLKNVHFSTYQRSQIRRILKCMMADFVKEYGLKVTVHQLAQHPNCPAHAYLAESTWIVQTRFNLLGFKKGLRFEAIHSANKTI